MESPELNEKFVRMLLPRLERISADSLWAHRASGVRGALIRLLEQMQRGDAVDPARLQANVERGLEILREAAGEYT
jgi:hypothetical protein